jgi:hypothetical protein
LCSIRWVGETWQDLDLGRPLAAPLEQCAQLLAVDLVTVRELAAKVEPYLRADGTRIWSLTQLERQLRPELYAGAEAATSTVDDRGSSTYRSDQADQHFQEPQWPTPTSRNTRGSTLWIIEARPILQNHPPLASSNTSCP